MKHNKKYYLHVRLVWLLALCAFVLPVLAQAATISFVISPAQVSVGRPATIAVHLNTDSDSVNAADGSISIPAGLVVGDVDVGGSAFSLWPTEPQFNLSTHQIVFAGGVPGGIAPTQDALLFTFVVTASSTDTYTIATKAISVYKNDGLGTRLVAPQATRDVAVVHGGAPAAPSAADRTAPQFVSVSIGSDPSLFGGKYYLSFFANDSQSSIDHYDVKEGWFGGYVRADRYWVLRDQGLRSDISVRAFDTAGNMVTQTIPASHKSNTVWIVWALLLLAFCILWCVRRKKY